MVASKEPLCVFVAREEMGIDLKAGGRRTGHKARDKPKSDNVYLKLLVKLYRFLARRTDTDFVKVVLKRLFMSKTNRPPLSLSRLAKFMKEKDDKIACIVGTVTDDVRMLEIPAMKICALRFTETARARIAKAGGECITFDQLALRDPKVRRARRVARAAPREHVRTRGFTRRSSPPRAPRSLHDSCCTGRVRRPAPRQEDGARGEQAFWHADVGHEPPRAQ